MVSREPGNRKMCVGGEEGAAERQRRTLGRVKTGREALKKVGHWVGKDAVTFFLWRFSRVAGATCQASWGPKEQKMGDLSDMVKDLRNVYLQAGKVISEFVIPPSVHQSHS